MYSYRGECTPVPSRGFVFVYIIAPSSVTRTGRTVATVLHRSENSIIPVRNLATNNDHSFRCDIGLMGGLNRVAHAQLLSLNQKWRRVRHDRFDRFDTTGVSSCKRGTK